MPSSTMEDQPEFKLPKDTMLPATLESVKEEEFEFTVKNGPNAGKKDVFRKWTWEFKITDGEYAGLRAWGDTDPKLTNHPDNKVRQWAETLLGEQFELGQGLDTDDLLALPCVIVVDNVKAEKKNGDPFYKCPVVDVFPADAMDALQDFAEDPPF